MRGLGGVGSARPDPGHPADRRLQSARFASSASRCSSFSGCDEPQRAATERHQCLVGLGDYAVLILVAKGAHYASAANFKAPQRAAIEAAGFRIIAGLIGDQPFRSRRRPCRAHLPAAEPVLPHPLAAAPRRQFLHHSQARLAPLPVGERVKNKGLQRRPIAPPLTDPLRGPPLPNGERESRDDGQSRDNGVDYIAARFLPLRKRARFRPSSAAM